MDQAIRTVAETARGFMPLDEGQALYDFAKSSDVPGPFLEIGSFCGKSTVYLGAAAYEHGRLLYALDHHRGSEENQVGWEWHEPELVDLETGLVDTLPFFRRTIHNAGLEGTAARPCLRSSRRLRTAAGSPPGRVARGRERPGMSFSRFAP